MVYYTFLDSKVPRIALYGLVRAFSKHLAPKNPPGWVIGGLPGASLMESTFIVPKIVYRVNLFSIVVGDNRSEQCFLFIGLRLFVPASIISKFFLTSFVFNRKFANCTTIDAIPLGGFVIGFR